MNTHYCGRCNRYTPYKEDTNEHEYCPWCNRIIWEEVARDCSRSEPLKSDTFEYDRKRQGLRKTARKHDVTAAGRVSPYDIERSYWIERYKAEGRGKPAFDHGKKSKLSNDTTVVIVTPASPAIGCQLAAAMRKEKGVKILQPLKIVEKQADSIVESVKEELFQEEIVQCDITPMISSESLDSSVTKSDSLSNTVASTVSSGISIQNAPSSPMEFEDYESAARAQASIDGIPLAIDACETVECDLPVKTRVEMSKCLSEPATARGEYRRWIRKLSDYSIGETRRWIDTLAMLPGTDLRSYHSIVCEIEAEIRARVRANDFIEQVDTCSIIGAFQKSA